MGTATTYTGTRRVRAAALALLILLLAAGLVAGATSALAVEGSRYRPPVESAGGIVATESPAASRAGRAVLLRGGNAVDAAVTTVFALSVARPQSCGIGGGGFMVVRTAGGRVAALDFRETAGAATTATTFAGPGPHRQFTGRRTVGVPGTVAGMQAALDTFGTLTLAEAIRPAEALAREGFRVPVSLANAITQNATRLKLFPGSSAQYLKGGTTPYAAGERLVQEDQADTLALIAAGGSDAFYRGPIARRIVADMANADQKLAGDLGLLTLQDFANYRAKFRAPLVGTYRGRTIVAMPPPTSGGIATLEMLNLLEGYDLRAFGPSSANALHVIAESQKIAFADRAAYLADPDVVRAPEALTTKAYATRRRAEIDLARAKTYPAGDVGAARARAAGGDPNPRGSTTHVSIVDAQGNAVALTCTIEQEFGSAVVVPGLGFLLNNELTDFSDPGTANQPAPSKRPRSSMSPTIVVRDDRPEAVIGGSGGVRIVMGSLLGVVGGVDFGRNVGQAIDAERIDANGPGGTVVAEGARLAPAVVADLTARGHRITNVGEYDIRPRIQIAGIDLDTGRRVGQSDPRSDFATLAARRPPAATGRPRADRRVPTVALARAVGDGEVTLSWTGRDRGTGIASYTVQVRAPGADGYTTVAARTARVRLAVPARRAGTYAFRVRATDRGGNVSAYDVVRARVGR